jgi:cellulose synthase/poly-beta-1,6-N-acetylglucosamine synthase-like glycosyltransferase
MLSVLLGVADALLLLLWARLLLWMALACRCYATERARKACARPQSPFPAVSVVVPAYNEEARIAATLASLAALSPPASEIIVVDDGSSDQTAVRAQEGLGLHPCGSLIRLGHNQGKANALNAGLSAARGDLIATVDADTILAKDALGLAVAELQRQSADAVAFRLEAAQRTGFLTLLQEREYALGFNFERAGQSLVGAIPVMPGAATLFRKEALSASPFSARTSTEDADLTLALSGERRRLILANAACAQTEVPTTARALLRQRIRWTSGHLHCSFLYLCSRSSSWRFRLVVLPNFLLATISSPLLCLLAALVGLAGQTAWLGLHFIDVTVISLAITYAQRLLAAAVVGMNTTSVAAFMVEPIVMGMVYALSFVGAVIASLSRHSNWGGARLPLGAELTTNSEPASKDSMA